MPLIKSKSKKALQENIHREIEAGKEPKQAAAIAYSVARQAGAHIPKHGKARHPKESNYRG